ncbi:lipoxygenase [Striga asiatica]|uniref:Lipoxygenase n=1 Tax=Striga asiatica TaxID=4170 RepID=A0A5A7NX56_STRAF|nr:lipoxygenase [Striga asiatica]
MLNQCLHRPQCPTTPQTLRQQLPGKPFLNAAQSSPIFIFSRQKSVMTGKGRVPRRRRPAGAAVKALMTPTATTAGKKTSVKAIVTVLETVGGALSHLGLDHSGQEKPTISAYAHKVGQEKNEIHYEAKFDISSDFGEIGAIILENEHRTEMFVKDVKFDGLPAGSVQVTCNSWVHSKYDNPENRVFFTDDKNELTNLRGDGQGERKKSDRIYDYDVYNDLGDPDADDDLSRPVLGGPQHPYPRRGRTGRPRTKKDPLSETRSSEFYVPRDEVFSEVKQATFSAKTLYSVLHALVPSLKSSIIDSTLGFPHFTAIDTLFNEGFLLPDIPTTGFLGNMIPRLVRFIKDTKNSVLQFETPELIDRDKFAWFRDAEFARQTLAGVNPCCIKLVTEWPLKSELDPKIYGPAESAITTELVEKEIGGFITVDEALKQKKLFILDYHDVFLPYVNKVRALEGTTFYGSRTLFCLMPEGVLRPVAIELVRPPIDEKPQWKEVYVPCWNPTSIWLWRLAKAHVLAHDSGFHQLRTHCCTEPYIIATNRHLSAMHPIYRLLHPHFRYTMEINALARQALINCNGIIESAFSPGKYSIELSSVAYDKLWQFDLQALPADLINSLHKPPAKPFLTAGAKSAQPSPTFIFSGQNFFPAVKKHVLRRQHGWASVKASLSPSAVTTGNTTNVKAVVTVLQPVGGVLSHLSLSRGLDDIADLLGKTLLIELSYLPSQTPSGLIKHRQKELIILRGDGQGERKTFERIYDYDVYNDLGDPDADDDLARPVLGGPDHPYPRRGRTGRPRSKQDPLSESKSPTSDVYVPRDEAFSEIKQEQYSAKTMYSVLHMLIPSVKTSIVDSSRGFPHFTAIDTLYNEGVLIPDITSTGLGSMLPRVVRFIEDTKDTVLQFETPELIDRDKFAWFRDAEFARQTLAGQNPLCIKLVTEWPLKSDLDPKIYGPAESAITKELVENVIGGHMTVDEALKQKKLFILDYHDIFLPYVNKIRELKGTTFYGSRTLFFLMPGGVLRPVAIELVRPPVDGKPQWKEVYQPSWNPTAIWLWRLAKAHLTIEDYPYANDGLLLYDAITEWVTDYVTHYYPEPNLVQSDSELQSWWTEIRTLGHMDKKDEPWWPQLKSPQDLIGILTTIIWVVSGHHAAVNFAQFDFGGYFPNRPTITRTPMPTEDPSEEDKKKFLERPEAFLLDCLPSQMQAMNVLAVLDVVSAHSPDEEYLGEKIEPFWAEDKVIAAAFKRFNGRMKEIEGIIDGRNADTRLMNRTGAGVVPYTLLKPFSEPGVTLRGVPNSVSI